MKIYRKCDIESKLRDKFKWFEEYNYYCCCISNQKRILLLYALPRSMPKRLQVCEKYILEKMGKKVYGVFNNIHKMVVRKGFAVNCRTMTGLDSFNYGEICQLLVNMI